MPTLENRVDQEAFLLIGPDLSALEIWHFDPVPTAVEFIYGSASKFHFHLTESYLKANLLWEPALTRVLPTMQPDCLSGSVADRGSSQSDYSREVALESPSCTSGASSTRSRANQCLKADLACPSITRCYINAVTCLRSANRFETEMRCRR